MCKTSNLMTYLMTNLMSNLVEIIDNFGEKLWLWIQPQHTANEHREQI